MIRPFLALALALASPVAALAQSAGSMGTGTTGSDSTGLQTSVPNAVHDQTSGSSTNAPVGQGGSANAGSTDTGTGPGNSAGAQTSLSNAVQNQTPAGSPAAH